MIRDGNGIFSSNHPPKPLFRTISAVQHVQPENSVTQLVPSEAEIAQHHSMYIAETTSTSDTLKLEG